MPIMTSPFDHAVGFVKPQGFEANQSWLINIWEVNKNNSASLISISV